MAIEPIGAPEPVRLAIAPLAVAREAVRLTQDENQRIRESRLDVSDDTAREDVRAENPAREFARQEVRQDVAREENSAQTDNAPARDNGRGETVDVIA